MTTEVSTRTLLSTHLCRILEDTAFMLVENTEADLPPPAPAIEASLRFGGKASGTCWLIVTEADAQTLATEMLGTDAAADTRSTVCDNAVSELLNILTAWLLDDWWGEGVEHTLGIPETRRMPLSDTRVGSVPAESLAIVSTDSECTFMSFITLE